MSNETKDIYWQGKIYHTSGKGEIMNRSEYMAWLNTFPSFPVHGKHLFTDGQLVVNGIDYEVKPKSFSDRQLVAVPLSVRTTAVAIQSSNRGEGESDKKELYDFLTSHNKPFKVGEVRQWVNEYLKEEISLSRLAEKMNEKVFYKNKNKLMIEEVYPTTVEALSDYDFYILNLRENKSIAINMFDDEQYRGITFYKTNLGWSLNPTKIGKGFLTSCKDDFDYTKDFELAKSNADQTK